MTCLIGLGLPTVARCSPLQCFKAFCCIEAPRTCHKACHFLSPAKLDCIVTLRVSRQSYASQSCKGTEYSTLLAGGSRSPICTSTGTLKH